MKKIIGLALSLILLSACAKNVTNTSTNKNINNTNNSESNISTDTENDHAVQLEEVAAQEISEDKLESKILNKIANIDINELRPSEAIRILEDLKEIIHEN